jgi:hypothetical protein
MSFADKIRLNKDVVMCLTNLKQIAASTEEILAEIERVMVRHLTVLLGRPPKMAKHIMGS